MVEEESVTLPKRPITIVIPSFGGFTMCRPEPPVSSPSSSSSWSALDVVRIIERKDDLRCVPFAENVFARFQCARRAMCVGSQEFVCGPWVAWMRTRRSGRLCMR